MRCAFRFVLGVILCLGSPALAQESMEPPPPRAAPRGIIMAEELPRAGDIMVFGGASAIGREIARDLVAGKKSVTVAVVENADTSSLEALEIKLRTVDTASPDQLKATFAAAPLRAVVAAYDIDGENPQLGLEGIRNIVDATKDAGVPRFVLVSATGAGDDAEVLPWYVRFLRGDAITGAGQAEAYLEASGLDYTIVRAGWVTDDPASAAVTLEEGETRFSWIANVDLARIVAEIVDGKAYVGKTATAFDPAHVSLYSVLF